ncbi:D-alanyl-D-alanine carboxypeptidase/D-alanyl-D-alanine-endopeptidase [Lewinella sp. 4G2]|nr:D-alanyl-D-alanine carboxypeptidase/D-alanyl-D-alanine-endopeptidase [Lewinella sp. 4G2]
MVGLCAQSVGLRAQTTLAERIAEFVDRPELAGASIGIDVIDLATGERVASHAAEQALIPASTLKLVTTAAAYDVLGPDHRFTTELVMTGTVVDGTLRGDLYIVGGGDPSLASPYMNGVPRLPALLERWRAAVARAGIRRIEGRVVGDASYFGTDGAAADWPWSDLGNYYGAGAYGLNIHENSYSLDLIQRSTLGTPPVIKGTRPEMKGLVLINELTSGPKGSGDQAYIYAAPLDDRAVVRGSIPVGTKRFTIRGSIPEPALYAARALSEYLEAEGISVSLPPESDRTVGGVRFSQYQSLDVYTSPTLLQLIERTNMRSNNLYAEAMLREIGKARGGALNQATGAQAIRDWLAERGLPTASLHLVDGSGLGPRNFFSPSFMTALLRDQSANTAWRSTLPVAGRSGSLKYRLRGTGAEGRLSAKSGSLHAVRCYAGYTTARDGRELAFAVMVNNYTVDGLVLRGWLMGVLGGIWGG